MSIGNLFGEPGAMAYNPHHDLWQAAKTGKEFEGEDAFLVQAMRDHPEYHDIWDRPVELGQPPVVINGVNPFLHVVMHSAIEAQAAQNDPPHVRAIIEFRTAHRIARHDIIHAIGAVFTESLWQVLRAGKPFDNAVYQRKLNQLLPRAQRLPKGA
jgi:hypothetical protein